jgi:predicted nucleotidyltransferase
MSESDAAIVDLPPAPPRIAADPVLRKIKAELARLYGPRLAGVVLYGSRARGDHRPDSDIDVMVLLNGDVDLGEERWRLAQLSTTIMLETGASPTFLVREEGALARRTIFMHNLREDGVRL